MKKGIVSLLIIGILAYSGFQFFKPYYRYLVLQSDAKEIVRIDIENEDVIRSKVYERAQELKIPIGKADIEVTKQGSNIRIKTSWSEVVDIFGVYQKTLQFNVDTMK